MTLMHTFGGSALDRYVYEFEPDTDGAGDAGTGAPAPDTATATATVDPAATGDTGATVDPAATADPAAAGGDPDDGVDETQFWNAVRDLVAEEVHSRSNGAGPQAAQPEPAAADTGGEPYNWGNIDPLSDEFGAQLGQGISHAVQQAMQEALNPLTSTIEQSQQAERVERGEQVLQDIIHDTITRGDDLTDEGKSGIRPLVDVFFGEAAQRFGAQNPRAAEVAAERAVEFVRGIERAAAARATTQQQNHLADLAGATTEPGASGAASAVAGTPARYPTTDDLIQRHRVL